MISFTLQGTLIFVHLPNYTNVDKFPIITNILSVLITLTYQRSWQISALTTDKEVVAINQLYLWTKQTVKKRTLQMHHPICLLLLLLLSLSFSPFEKENVPILDNIVLIMSMQFDLGELIINCNEIGVSCHIAAVKVCEQIIRNT